MKKILFFPIGLALLASCNNINNEGLSRDELIDSIETLDSLDAYDMVANPEKANEIIALFNQFVNQYPDDSLTPIYLMKMAETQIALGEFEQGIANLDSIILRHPDFEDVAGCQFLKGWAYEQNEQYDEAREAYTEFVTRYPDHVLAADVKKTLPLVGLSPEEQLKKVRS
jgi:tetratricopeptide (TPR) repeat protein